MKVNFKKATLRLLKLLLPPATYASAMFKLGKISKDAYNNILIEEIIKKGINKNSVCIDVGCHKGSVLDLMLKYAPNGRFIAFEPLPDLYNLLEQQYSDCSNICLYNYALADKTGITSFNYVINNPGYSGIIKRPCPKNKEPFKEATIEVKKETLDKVIDLIDSNIKVDLIKIDVEGGEEGVIKGGINTIKKSKPLIIFEHAEDVAQVYGTTSASLFDLINDECGLKISIMQDWLEGKKPLQKADFVKQLGINYNFVAHP